MYSIDGDHITLTRGDTFFAQVSLSREVEPDVYEPYTPQTGDRVRFALKQSLNARGTDFREPQPLILKEIPIDTMILRIDPEDTKPLGFGQYRYDIEITFVNGIVDTFIADARFDLTPEVH